MNLKENLNKIYTFIVEKRFWVLLGICILLVILLFTRQPVVVVHKEAPTLDTVIYKKDENDKLLAEIQTVVMQKQAAERLADSLARALKVKPKQIKGADVLVYKHDTTLLPGKTIVIQTPKDTSFIVGFRDNYISMNAQVSTSGNSKMQLSSTDTLYRTEVVKTPLFGKEKHYITVRNTSPYNSIKYGSSWVTEEKRTWISIGPSIQYNPFTQKFDIGVSIQYPLIKIKK